MVFIVVVSVGLMELMTSLFIDSLMDEKQRMERRKSNENEERRKEVQQMMTGESQPQQTLSSRRLPQQHRGWFDRGMPVHCTNTAVL